MIIVLKPIKRAFTLIEIMIVIAVIGIIVSIAVPAYLRAREVSRARGCQETLSKIDGAVDMYALEFKLNSGDAVTFEDLIKPQGTGFLKRKPACPAGGTYETTLHVNEAPKCSIGANNPAPFAPHVLNRPVPD